jgi:hypothetical protein
MPIKYWHAKALRGLTRGLSYKFHGASLYVESFCKMDKSSEDYWLDHFMRQLCGINDGVAVAKEVVTDYLWVRKVAECGSAEDVAHHIDHVLQASETLRSKLGVDKTKERGRSSGWAKAVLERSGAMSERDVEGLKKSSNVFRHEIPSYAGRPVRNKFDSGNCPLHPRK